MVLPVGLFFDPLHGGCLRVVYPSGDSTYTIVGVYGTDEMNVGKTWTAFMREISTLADGSVLMEVDFSGKLEIVHERLFHARWYSDTRKLIWQDENVWIGIYSSRKQLNVASTLLGVPLTRLAGRTR